MYSVAFSSPLLKTTLAACYITQLNLSQTVKQLSCIVGNVGFAKEKNA